MTVSGNNASRVLVEVLGAGGHLGDAIHGRGYPAAGGVLNFGDLNLTDCIISGNTSTQFDNSNFPGKGGALYNTGTMTTAATAPSAATRRTVRRWPAKFRTGLGDPTAHLANNTAPATPAVGSIAHGDPELHHRQREYGGGDAYRGGLTHSTAHGDPADTDTFHRQTSGRHGGGLFTVAAR